MPISAAGVGSGLDVNGIVQQLMTIESRPLELLAAREAKVQAKLSAYGSLKGSLATLRSAAAALAKPARFRAATAAVADPALASASASAGASGTYALEVQQLAQSQKLRSVALASSASVLGSGNLTIEFGTYAAGAFSLNADKAAKSVAICAGQNTLAGVRDAINAADAGVIAGIVSDGNGARLVLTSVETGAANALRITVDDIDGNDTDAAGLSRLAYDAAAGGTAHLLESAAARDALAVIDGIAIASASNTLDTAIDGVSLTLLKEAPGTTTTLTVKRDVDGAKAAIDAFVKAYNDAAKAIRSLTAYDTATRTAAVLQGETTAASVQSRLRATLGAAVEFAGGYDGLSALGIAFQKDGMLLSDATKLRATLADTAKDAATALSVIGTPSDGLVKFASATADAEGGEYALQVTQLATRGAASGSTVAALTIAAGVNDTLTLEVDGVSQTVTLATGNYSAEGLAAMLQTRVAGVDASAAAGVLTLTSRSWGSTSSITITGGSAAADLFGTPASSAGVNAAGTLGGAVATAAGRNLQAKGLTVTVEGGGTGARGTLRFSRGIADRLDTLIGDILDDSVGARTTGLGATISSLGAERARIESRLESVERRLRAQFSALDNMVASMNATSSFLTQQLASLPRPASGS